MASLPFRRYVAVGDSVSIDLYPGLDAAEREGMEAVPFGLGAASLLARNDDLRYPEFEGRDLCRLCPGVRFRSLCEDGAGLEDVWEEQLPRLHGTGPGPTLVTLTAGGNDLLGLAELAAVGWGPWIEARGMRAVRGMIDRLGAIVDRLRRELPDAVVLVATVYDPTDGTGKAEGLAPGVEPLRWLEAFNEGVRGLTDGEGVRLADLHRHFLGHGVGDPDPSGRWYWRRSMIEPGLRGASEVRGLWLEALAV